jgi:L-2-hydroxyglutarate oxidase LhgO
MADFDMLVVGAGVVGLAVARAAAREGASVLIAERNRHFGAETSSRNSEVIHAGIYYPPGSLKAELCRDGRRRLYGYAADAGVPARRVGKLIVACEAAQIPLLESIAANAAACDVTDLTLLGPDEVASIEPSLRAAAGLLSPSTGIIDSHAYMLALLGEAEAQGAELVPSATISRLERSGSEWKAWIAGEAGPVLSARTVVNAAGLWATEVAGRIEGYSPAAPRATYYAKGTYFAYGGKVPFSRLIYPVPEAGGLGIHLTLDRAGRARFGPDVEWCETLAYDVDANRRAAFAQAIRSYWPDVEESLLTPDFAGVRPKLVPRGQAAHDFVVEGPGDHGLPGVVNLFGIESPGLTASLPLGEMAARLALD